MKKLLALAMGLLLMATSACTSDHNLSAAKENSPGKPETETQLKDDEGGPGDFPEDAEATKGAPLPEDADDVKDGDDAKDGVEPAAPEDPEDGVPSEDSEDGLSVEDPAAYDMPGPALKAAHDQFKEVVQSISGLDGHDYPFDIAGVYYDQDELVVMIVDGFENRYEKALGDDLPIRYVYSPFSLYELEATFHRIEPYVSDKWYSFGIRVTRNAISFTIDEALLTPLMEVTDDLSLKSYMDAVASDKIENVLAFDLEKLETFLAPLMLEHVIFEVGEQITIEEDTDSPYYDAEELGLD